MKKNTLLRIASFICRFMNVLILISVIIYTVFFIHFQLDRSAYDDWKFTSTSSGSIFKFEQIRTIVSEAEGTGAELISTLSTTSLYFNYIKYVTIWVLMFLSLRLLNKVIVSVKDLSTFQEINASAFKQIGFYFLIIACLSTFEFWDFGAVSRTGISIDFHFFIIALLAFVVAEIFKEGNQLKQENELTI